MPVFKDWLIKADWTQGAITILNEQLWATTFFFSALENFYLVTVWNKDLEEQVEQLNLLASFHKPPYQGNNFCCSKFQ